MNGKLFPFIASLFFLLTPINSEAQKIKALVPAEAPSFQPAIFEKEQEGEGNYLERNETLSRISEIRETKNVEPKDVFNFITDYGEREPRELEEEIEDKNALEAWVKYFEKELNDDVFYYSRKKRYGEDNEIYYDGQAISALGRMLLNKYEFVRKVDRGIRKVKESTSLHYTSDNGFGIKARPCITETDDLKIKVTIDNFLGIRKIYSKIGQDEIKTSVCKKLKSGNLYFEGLSNLDRKEEQTNVYFEKPFW